MAEHYSLQDQKVKQRELMRKVDTLRTKQHNAIVQQGPSVLTAQQSISTKSVPSDDSPHFLNQTVDPESALEVDPDLLP
jgi:hypothetical protein